MPKILLNVRENILNAGEELLKANGYNNLNIREVASKCNIAVGTLYNYFSNKDELVEEIIFDHWKEVLVHIDILTTSKITLREKLIALSQHLDSFFKTYSGVFADMMESNAARCPRHEIFPHLHKVVENMINIAIEQGEVNPRLSVQKLSKILVPSMFFITRVEDLTFEDFYSILNFN